MFGGIESVPFVPIGAGFELFGVGILLINQFKAEHAGQKLDDIRGYIEMLGLSIRKSQRMAKERQDSGIRVPVVDSALEMIATAELGADEDTRELHIRTLDDLQTQARRRRPFNYLAMGLIVFGVILQVSGNL